MRVCRGRFGIEPQCANILYFLHLSCHSLFSLTLHTTLSFLFCSLLFDLVLLLLFPLQAEDEIHIQEAIDETTVGIYVVKHEATSRPDDIGIVLEGLQVLQDLDSIALAVAMLFGLMYALNLNYPDDLKYSFEALQKIVMELEGTVLSKKVQVLKNRLNEQLL